MQGLRFRIEGAGFGGLGSRLSVGFGGEVWQMSSHYACQEGSARQDP